jgi:UDP-glucose 4-epimerase|tara:strand:+ start:612 stop:1460 length:849 start_codon:yes stop_codon:yes gene_type:complete
MKVLVTGGAGFIGTNLIKRLLNEGHEVVSLDDYETGTKDNHVEGAKYIDGDIETIEYIQGDYDLCFHLAALSRIQPSFENPTETFRVNVRGTEAVCEWAKHNNVKVVYAGSSSKHHDPSQSPYAAYKYLGEEVCKLYKKTYDLNVEICRFYNVYGPDEVIEGDWAAVIGIWRRQVRDGEKITIVGDGEQRRDFTHVVDIVDGLYKVAVGTEVHEDAWELGCGVNYSINEMFNMFKERFPQLESIYLPDQPGNYRKTLRENNDTLERLSWKPEDRLNDYIQSL